MENDILNLQKELENTQVRLMAITELCIALSTTLAITQSPQVHKKCLNIINMHDKTKKKYPLNEESFFELKEKNK